MAIPNLKLISSFLSTYPEYGIRLTVVISYDLDPNTVDDRIAGPFSYMRSPVWDGTW